MEIYVNFKQHTSTSTQLAHQQTNKTPSTQTTHQASAQSHAQSN